MHQLIMVCLSCTFRRKRIFSNMVEIGFHSNGNDNLVSGSSQIDDLGFLKVDGDSVVSGSSQLDGFVSSSSVIL